MKKHKIGITDTTLRDGHQSLWATRMTTEQMLPIIEKIDNIGYHSLEVWGGATFDVCMRYLDEDPWERLRKIKKHAHKTPLQMLLRGQSLVGYQHYPDDVVEAFVHKSVENGIDIIRIFDALNDIRNMETAMRATRAAGAHVQATVVYTISPVHTTEHYLETAIKLGEMGADSICIKDMAGLLTPYSAYELVRLLKEKLSLPLQLHSHYIGGMAVVTYLKAAEAGVDYIDTATVPLAFGASQPPVETVDRAFQGTPFDPGLNIHELFEVAEYFETLRKAAGFERGVTRISDMRVFEHQIPGGMITNLVSQLEQQKALHRLDEVYKEIPRVREDLGYPPLVTPTSQIVGTQAVLNVLSGQRYKMVPGEVKAYVQGWYGKPPAAINPEVVRKIIGDQEIIDVRPADLLEPKMVKHRIEIQDLARSEEDVLSYALFPQVARKFFEWRLNPAKKAESAPAAAQLQQVNRGTREAAKMNLNEIKELIKLLDETDISELSLESEGVKVAIKKGFGQSLVAPNLPRIEQVPARREEEHAVDAIMSAPAKVAAKEDLIPVVAPMVGSFYSSPSPEAPAFVQIGDLVQEGKILGIIEAMKLMNEIQAEVSGEIVDILVENGQPVEYGQTMFLIRKK